MRAVYKYDAVLDEGENLYGRGVGDYPVGQIVVGRWGVWFADDIFHLFRSKGKGLAARRRDRGGRAGGGTHPYPRALLDFALFADGQFVAGSGRRHGMGEKDVV